MTDDTSKDKPPHPKKKVSERDALDKLSLAIIPLSSLTLRNARLIKNSRMETSLELLNDPISGSLQVSPDDIADVVSGNPQDHAIIRALAALNSYDVYSLRTSLKKLGLEVDQKNLTLSEEMKEMLVHHYMLSFTRPLIDRIFGFDNNDTNAPEDVSRLLNDPDVARVRRNLKIMSDKTGIPLEDIPTFLSAYSDVFLSVAYYRYSFDSMKGDIRRFVEWIRELQTHREISASSAKLASCRHVEETLRNLTESVHERMERFNKTFQMFWGNINQQSFEELRRQVEENHDSLGAVLCGLMVKIHNWTYEFPDNTVGGPAKRAAFVKTEMEPGLEKLKVFENAARQKIGLPPLA